MFTPALHHTQCTSEKCLDIRRYAIRLNISEVYRFCERCVRVHSPPMKHLLTLIEPDLEQEKGTVCYICKRNLFRSHAHDQLFKFKAGAIGCSKCIKFDPLWDYAKHKLYYDSYSWNQNTLCKIAEDSKLKVLADKRQIKSQVLLSYIYDYLLNYRII